MVMGRIKERLGIGGNEAASFRTPLSADRLSPIQHRAVDPLKQWMDESYSELSPNGQGELPKPEIFVDADEAVLQAGNKRIVVREGILPAILYSDPDSEDGLGRLQIGRRAGFQEELTRAFRLAKENPNKKELKGFRKVSFN